MENNELLKRADELSARARRGRLAATGFLSPAERYELEQWSRGQRNCRLVFSGGRPECERSIAFFLPDYMEEDELDLDEHIRVIKLRPHFGSPGHRDYMGAILGMGIDRRWLGDIWIMDDCAWVFCLPSVRDHLLGLDKAGRVSLSAEAAELSELPPLQRRLREESFTVMSMRLDAVLAGLFRLSRSEAARQIAAGNVSLNYAQCLKADREVKEGDVISLKGCGKAEISGTGGSSRKGRLFVYGNIYL